ncbi:prolyl oligopeptidase family serine peptidase [Dyadobacter subterraneus]|uniref:Prolyl oligopeptidase family serine peptidase n=1 Tax=Dyadobacter subterraneus TaxID=2773304 RepID=A0ABR9WAC1_9BACT|nr:prolyl oligopeptidase family serine peptidase [Dyadobacter subterraneus]MBE9462410.1 prolyl oligopeptidase family serine peptidase [Dyadobacter subterraneus]
MRKIILGFFFVIICISNPARSQTVYKFTDGLAVGPCHQYGREAIYKDELAYQLYSGLLTKPQEGSVFTKNEKGEEVKWKPVKTDTSGRFRGEAFTNGYIYLTYQSSKEQSVLLNITGHDMVYVNGVPRGGDAYRYGWMHLPVQLKKGNNQFYIRVARFGRFGGITAKLTFPQKAIAFNTDDLTLPHIVPSLRNDSLWLGIVVLNTTSKKLSGLQVNTDLSGKMITTKLPEIPPMSSRKVAILVDARGSLSTGKHKVGIRLQQNKKAIDETSVELESIAEGKHYSRTFVSAMDGSVQYYSVAPQSKSDGTAPALFLSVHGAEVQAINQARAYKPKDWGVVVAPTNRRPRGFNWEDWGRIDALEVFEIAKKQYKPDPSRIYLTGHSMGGHGTWFLGATYPGNWAAIAPSAGYPNLSSYGSHDGQIPENSEIPMEAILLRASNPSNVLALATNYKTLGVYVAHGDADKTVSVEYARQMRKLLGTFHNDFSYYEYPGGEHWYGDESVDWAPIFNFFSWHKIKKDTADNHIDFKTANPGISSKMRWAGIYQQTSPLNYSRIQLDRDKIKNSITGKTENTALLSLNLGGFSVGKIVTIKLDSLADVQYTITKPDEIIYLKKENGWKIAAAPDLTQKNPLRYGTFKDGFKSRMIYVYATNGSKEENNWAFEKARFDSETWYFRGNGAVDIVADKDFEPAKFPDRGIVLYGNSENNLAWNKLLGECPVKVTRGKIVAGEKQFSGDDLAAYFIWPRKDSDFGSISVIAGTGMKGLKAANANQYFSGGSGFADLMIFSADMLKSGVDGVKMAGFFGNDWSFEKGEFVKK